MYFVIVKEISTGKIVDKAELTATDNIGGELAHLAWLTKKQFENRYPSEKYNVAYEEAADWDELQNKLKSSNLNSDGVFTMAGSRTNLFLINIGAIVAGIILLFILLVIRLIYNPFIFIFGIFILFCYFYIDTKIWLRRGIQQITIDKQGLTVFKGSKNIPIRVDKNQITGINVFNKLNRKVVNILLGGYADSSLPGVTLFSGPRIRITDDAFNSTEFNIFIEKLKELKPDLFFKNI